LRSRDRRFLSTKLLRAKLVRPYLKKQNKNKRAGNITQVIRVFSKCKALGSIPSTAKRKKGKKIELIWITEVSVSLLPIVCFHGTSFLCPAMGGAHSLNYVVWSSSQAHCKSLRNFLKIMF
jgi:hypothetical protein